MSSVKGYHHKNPRKPIGDDIRFWAKVEKTDTCWLWTANVAYDGYGKFWVDGTGGRNTPSHRWAYESLIGPIPDGLVLDHLCRVRNCVNPAHLEPVSGEENILRGTSPAAENARKTHCSRGHAFDAANTYHYLRNGKPARSCRICRLIAQHKYVAKGTT